MDDNADQGHPAFERTRWELSRRGLVLGASALAAARILGGRDAVSADAGPAEINEGAIGSFALASRGQQVQVTPPPPPPPLRWRPGQFIMNVDVAERRMALTFDDGPSPYNTPSVLQTLSNYGIKATFFLVGVNVQSFPALARRLVDEGHELGNHSVYHTPYQSSALAAQIGPNQAIIQNATNVTPIVNRAPGLTKGGAILNTCAAYGLYECHTHMSTFDYLAPRHSASQLVSEFTRYHRNGAFALYHDGGNRRPTPDALPSIISYGLSVGYTFVTATELVNSGNPQPGSGSYLTAAALQDDTTSTEYVDVCGYDAAAELSGMLARDDLSLSALDRSRIVGALADIDAVSRD